MSWTNVIEETDGSISASAVGGVSEIGSVVQEIKTIKPKKTKQTITPSDPVNSPAHYTAGGIETIDYIEAKELGYNLGNVVKYISRADKKGKRLEDLRKAKWYLVREIELEEKE
jgi:hypothetical protein